MRNLSRWILCAFLSMATMAAEHRYSRADDGTWSRISDVTQYVPLAYAAVQTVRRADGEGALQVAAAGGLTLGAAELLKEAVDKKRPNYRRGQNENSFPSGHTAKAWFAAAHVQRRYGCYRLEWSCWRGAVIPYTAAVITAVGRVRADRHYWQDVIASGVIAEAFVRLTTDRFDENVRVVPALGNGFGIAVVGRF